MKNYENNMADQDVIVHSIRVLQDIDSPTTRQLTKEVNLTKEAARSVAQKSDKYWQELSSDGIITPIEKKIIQREMENIANSYTALYTEAVAEHYDTADFFLDYMATYNALRNYIYTILQLFNNMEENTEVDRDEFNEYFADYYYSENFAIVSMTVGVVASLGFKILTSLEDEGEEGDVGLYHGELYQYVDNGWKPLDRDLYYGKSAIFPPEMEGRYFLNTANSYLDDDLYLSADGEDYEQLELNGENLTVFTDYEKGIIYSYEDHHWDRKDPATDYRYIVAMGDYYSVKDALPGVMNDKVAEVAKAAAGTNYYGPLTSPTQIQTPKEGDFFLYIGETTAEIIDHKWIKFELYVYRNNNWVWLDESNFQNRDFFMQALQDILERAPATEEYFSTVFCNSFFGNQASLNALSTKVIYLDTGGALRSKETEYIQGEQGLLIDAEGNIDANGDTHIGGTCVIDGECLIGGQSTFRGLLDSATGLFRGRLRCGSLIVDNDQISLRLLSINAGTTADVLYDQLYALGFDDTTRNVSDVLSEWDVVDMKYGNTTITTVRIWKRDLYPTFEKGVVLNGTIELWYDDHVIDPPGVDYYTYIDVVKYSTLLFKAENLPPSKPDEHNIIYAGTDGILRIS